MAPDKDAAFDAALAPYAGAARVPTPQAAAAFPSPNPELFQRRAIPPEYVGFEKGSEGVAAPPPLALDEGAILKGCAFLGDAVRQGGKLYDNPLWNLTTLAATWFKNGRFVAHAMADKHEQYSFQDTDALYERKIREREKGVGWPSCNAIQRAGCGSCAVCPHFMKGKSPFDLGKGGPKPAAPAQHPTIAGRKLFQLPNGYAFNPQGVICKVEVVKVKDAEGDREEPDLRELFQDQYILDEPWLSRAPNMLHFTFDGSVGEAEEAHIERGILSSAAETTRVLMSQGIAPTSLGRKTMHEFLGTLARRIEQAKKTLATKSFGWMMDDKGEPEAFVYGGKTFHRDGRITPGGVVGEEMKRLYTPKGDVKHWREAADFVIKQKRPVLEVILASSFAAPLFLFSGQTLGVFSAYGGTSGGKTTTSRTALAVWSDPYESPIPPIATNNQVQNKMGVISHLPVVFNEIGTKEEAEQNVFEILWQEGQEKPRLHLEKASGNLEPRKGGSWNTIAVLTANRSFAEFVNRKQPDNKAGRARVFEVHVGPHNGAGDAKWDIDPMIERLRYNFGGIGLDYAQKLALAAPTLRERIRTRGKAFGKLVDEKHDERIWTYICVCILVGAEMAKEFGYADFDLVAMEQYLVEQHKRQRMLADAEGQEGPGAAIELLTAFLKEHFNTILVTDGVHKKGRPPVVGSQAGRRDAWAATPHYAWKVLRAPTRVEHARGVYVHMINEPGQERVRFAREKLDEWLKKRNKPLSMIYDRLPLAYALNGVKLGAGTPFTAAGKERVLEVHASPTGPNSWLHDIMLDLISTVGDH